MDEHLAIKPGLDAKDVLDFVENQVRVGKNLKQIESILFENGWVIRCGKYTPGVCHPRRCMTCGSDEFLGQESPAMQNLEAYLRKVCGQRRRGT